MVSLFPWPPGRGLPVVSYPRRVEDVQNVRKIIERPVGLAGVEVGDILRRDAGWSWNNYHSQIEHRSRKGQADNLRYAVGPPGTRVVLLAARNSGVWSHLGAAIAAVLSLLGQYVGTPWRVYDRISVLKEVQKTETDIKQAGKSAL